MDAMKQSPSTRVDEPEDPATHEPFGPDEPRPWLTPEDRRGWRTVARGQGRPGRVPVRSVLEITLDPERSEWLFAEAERTGIDAQQVVEALIDRARGSAP